MAETVTAYGVRLPDGRVTLFRAREGAEDHIAYLRKARRYAELVSRQVVYGDWESVDRTIRPEDDLAPTGWRMAPTEEEPDRIERIPDRTVGPEPTVAEAWAQIDDGLLDEWGTDRTIGASDE